MPLPYSGCVCKQPSSFRHGSGQSVKRRSPVPALRQWRSTSMNPATLQQSQNSCQHTHGRPDNMLRFEAPPYRLPHSNVCLDTVRVLTLTHARCGIYRRQAVGKRSKIIALPIAVSSLQRIAISVNSCLGFFLFSTTRKCFRPFFQARIPHCRWGGISAVKHLTTMFWLLLELAYCVSTGRSRILVSGMRFIPSCFAVARTATHHPATETRKPELRDFSSHITPPNACLQFRTEKWQKVQKLQKRCSQEHHFVWYYLR
jgi:hypothetical protein